MGRYSAFISYSHADTAVASALQHALETYRVPKGLVDTPGQHGAIPRRLKRCFRDRDELAASADLGSELRAALAEADFQIVICSERAAASKWVNEEILSYKAMHGEARTFALISGGEPYDPVRECFPPAMRFKVGPHGLLTTEPAEPIAADCRVGKDGRRLAHLKLIAAITGARLDQLVRRDEARRRKRLVAVATGSAATAVVTAGLAFYANIQRVEAQHQRQAAEAQRRTAEASLDFLIGTFQIANPATENPKTISAVTMIHRVSERAKTDLKSQPAVSARLLRATGDILLALGQRDDAERDFAAGLHTGEIDASAKVRLLTSLTFIAIRKGDAKRASALLAQARALLPTSNNNRPELLALLEEREGQLLQLQGKPKKALDAFAAAVTLFSGLGGDHRVDLARILRSEGLALNRAGQINQAEAVLLRAQALYTNLYGPADVRVASVLQDRAVAALAAKRYLLAKSQAERVVAIYNKVYEHDHPERANAYILVGRIEHALQQYDDAVRNINAGLAMHAKLLGPLSYYVGDDYYYLAEILSDQHRYDAALNAVESAKKVYDKTYGPLDPDQAELLMVRAKIHRASGDRVAARSDCEAAAAIRAKLNPRDPELTKLNQQCVAFGSDKPGSSVRFS